MEARAPVIPGWILHDRARTHTWAVAGRASVKSFSGRAVYELEGRTVAVDRHRFLLLNDGEDYRITIEEDLAVESFCVFFDPGALEATAFSLGQTVAASLDDPVGSVGRMELLSQPRRHDDLVSPALDAFRRAFLGEGDHLQASEAFHRLMAAVVFDQATLGRQRERIGAARAVTRGEILRRLAIARDYLYENAHDQVTIADLSRAAALSPNRLIQHYREAFGLTPYRHLRRIRLEEARRRLEGEGDVSVAELALDLGYHSPTAFSTAFRGYAGASPAEWRRQTTR